jgi:hypothetical protein
MKNEFSKNLENLVIKELESSIQILEEFLKRINNNNINSKEISSDFLKEGINITEIISRMIAKILFEKENQLLFKDIKTESIIEEITINDLNSSRVLIKQFIDTIQKKVLNPQEISNKFIKKSNGLILEIFEIVFKLLTKNGQHINLIIDILKEKANKPIKRANKIYENLFRGVEEKSICIENIPTELLLEAIQDTEETRRFVFKTLKKKILKKKEDGDTVYKEDDNITIIGGELKDYDYESLLTMIEKAENLQFVQKI